MVSPGNEAGIQPQGQCLQVPTLDGGLWPGAHKARMSCRRGWAGKVHSLKREVATCLRCANSPFAFCCLALHFCFSLEVTDVHFWFWRSCQAPKGAPTPPPLSGPCAPSPPVSLPDSSHGIKSPGQITVISLWVALPRSPPAATVHSPHVCLGSALRTHPGGGFATGVQAPVQDKRGWRGHLGETVPESPESGTSWYTGASMSAVDRKGCQGFKTWYYYGKGIVRTNKHFMEDAISQSGEAAYRPENSRTLCPQKSSFYLFPLRPLFND